MKRLIFCMLLIVVLGTFTTAGVPGPKQEVPRCAGQSKL